MRKPIKVYVVGYDWCNITSFLLFDFEKVDNIKEADIVMFTGGEDINPALYGDVPHPTTHFTNRDDMEVLAFKDAPKEALLIGGCRGAQLLTALSGGKLFWEEIFPHAIYLCIHQDKESYVHLLLFGYSPTFWEYIYVFRDV